MFKISFSNIFIMDANFADLCENVNNFSKDGIFESDRLCGGYNWVDRDLGVILSGLPAWLSRC